MKIIAFAFLFFALSACAPEPVEGLAFKASPEVIKSQKRYTTTYLINSGDILEVIVDRAPELGRTVTVRPDGVITIPGAGAVRVAGMSTTSAARRIESAFGDRLLDPEVTVIVTNPPVPSIFVTGEVGGARSIPLRDVTTAAEAVVLAGGLQRSASLDRMALIRLDDDGFLRASIIEAQGEGEMGLFLSLSGIILEPGDILVATESPRSQFVRALQDFVSTPLVALNAIISPFVQLELLRDLRET